LSSVEVDQLVAYVQQIDGDVPVRRLAFDPPPSVGDSGGRNESGMHCALSGGHRPIDGSTSSVLGLGALAALARRRLRSSRSVRGALRKAGASLPRLAASALLTLTSVTGCMKDEPSGATPSRAPTDWAQLPAVVAPDTELAPLGSR